MTNSHRLPFFDKLTGRIDDTGSLLCIGLDPNPDQVPDRFVGPGTTLVQQLLAWNVAVIEETAPFACAFKPNIAFYEALGAQGYGLLRDTLEAIPSGVPVILDAKRGDIGSTAAAYARACFEDLGVDAVTLSPYLGRDSIQPFIEYAGKALFLLCRTSNPGSSDFQELEISDWRSLDREANQPLYLHVARAAASWSPDIGLVVGATFPASLAAVRSAVPDAWLLVPGVGAQGGDLSATIDAGLRYDGLGLIVNVSRGVSLADDPAAAAKWHRDEMGAARQARTRAATAMPERSGEHELDGLCRDLVALGAIQFGEFTLASGSRSPVYIDLRLLASAPALLAEAARRYAAILRRLPADRIAGVPYAALPIGTAVALASDMPMIYPRKEVKEYGLQKGIEGIWNAGDRVVIIEDLITSGGSTLATVERLRSAGLVVEHAIVLIDREQGGVENLGRHGVTAHSVFTLSDMLDSLVRQGQIETDQAREVRTFISRGKTQ